MPEADNTLAFRLVDQRDGVKLTPETVDVPTLRSFLQEAENFVKGGQAPSCLNDSRLDIKSGSIVFLIHVDTDIARNVKLDLQRLSETKDLDSIDPKRAQILEKWQSRTHSHEHRSYGIGPNEKNPIITITNETAWDYGLANSWVMVEKYLSGKVVDMGGKTKANIHLMTNHGESIIVEASEESLAAETENHLYSNLTIRVKAEENIYNRKIRNAEFLEFVPSHSDIDQQALEKLWEKGSTAWSGVENASSWVEELRGH